VLSDDMPVNGDSITLDYDKTSNFVYSNGTSVPIQTAVTYQVFRNGVLINSSADLLPANSDTSTPQTFSFPWTFSSEGLYNFVITATGSDSLCTGNNNYQEQINQEIYVGNTTGVDTIAPILSINSPLNATYTTQVTSFDFTAIDSNLNSCWYSTDNGITNTTVPCISGLLKSVPETSVTGTNTWTVYANDTSGNEASLSVTFNVNTTATDTTPPTVVISAPLNATYSSPVTSLNFTATDTNLNSCWYTINGGLINTTVSCTSGILESVALTSVNGTNTWTVYANDTSGNEASDTVTFTYDSTFIDTTPPVITVIEPLDNTDYDGQDFLFEITTNEFATAWFSLDGNANITMNTADNLEFTYPLSVEDGDHEVIFYAMDLTGNTASESISFSVNEDNKKDDKSTSKSMSQIFKGESNITESPIIKLEGEKKASFLSWFNWLLIILIILLIIAVVIAIFKRIR